MNKKLLSIHKYLSLVIFIPIILISLSGSILVYKYEVANILLSNILTIEKQGKTLSLDRLVDSIKEVHPNYEIVGWLIPKNKKLAHEIYLIEHGKEVWNMIYLNPYTGSLLNNLKPKNDYFTDIVDEVHTTLFLSEKGPLITGFFGLIFCFVAMSGIILYKKFWINLFKLKFNKKTFSSFKNFHKFIGVISSPILLIIGITGTYWSLDKGLSSSKKVDYIIKPNLYNPNISLDSLYHKVNTILGPNTLHYISFPYKEKKPITFYSKVKDTNILYDQYSNIIKFNKHTSEVESIYKISDTTFKNKFLNTFRKAHYGYYNEFTKFIWFLIGLSPLLLSISGLVMMYKKKNNNISSGLYFKS